MNKLNENDKVEIKSQVGIKGDINNLQEEMNVIKDNLEVIVKHLTNEETVRVKKKDFKLPFNIKRNLKKKIKANYLLAVILKKNKQLEFRLVKTIGGIIDLGNYIINQYDEEAVYTYKNFPVVVVFEYRIIPVGGSIEKIKAEVLGGSNDSVEIQSRYNALDTEVAQTILKAVEVAKNEGFETVKPKKYFLWWLIGGVIVLYFVGSALGFF